MSAQFRFENGNVHFKSRYVRNERWLAQDKAGKILFPMYRNPYLDDPSVKGKSRGTHNTHIIHHDGKLLAFKEDSPPAAMDLNTLERGELACSKASAALWWKACALRPSRSVQRMGKGAPGSLRARSALALRSPAGLLTACPSPSRTHELRIETCGQRAGPAGRGVVGSA